MTYKPSIAERITWSSGLLRSSDTKVLAALASMGDWLTGQHCRPYLSTLVMSSGLSQATVTRSLRRLEAEGWIVATVRRHRHATSYDICADRLLTEPPKRQQMTIAHATPPVTVDAQNEQQGGSVAQIEQQDPEFDAQNEHPISLPDLDLHVHTPTRAREDAPPEHAEPELALLSELPPPKCTHSHAHAWCEGRVHVPRDLHFEFLDQLGTRPGESRTQKAGRLVAFYADEMARLPAEATIADRYAFWKTAFKAWVAREAPAPAITAAAMPPEPYDMVWRQIRDRIETKVNRYTFETWFRPLVMVTASAALIEVTKQGPQSGLFADWIAKHYGDVVQAAVDEVQRGARVDVIDVWAIREQQSRNFG